MVLQERTGVGGGGDRLRVNELIRVREVRLILQDGTQAGILTVEEARHKAEEAGLDLVEVSPNAAPPVCKLMDFGKYLYQQKKRDQEAHKKQHVVELKEIRLRPQTGPRDLEIKLAKVREWLADGMRVQITLRFRGREVVHRREGEDRLQAIVKAVEDVGKLESRPMMENKQLKLVIGPKQRGGKSGARAAVSAAKPAVPPARPPAAAATAPLANPPAVPTAAPPAAADPPAAAAPTPAPPIGGS